jgi:hypothetical protein
MERPSTPEQNIINNITPPAPKKKKKKKNNRCSHCNKKYGLMKFTCKCNNLFCLTCKNPEAHNCSFDYKTHGKEVLVNRMNRVINNKIIKI